MNIIALIACVFGADFRMVSSTETGSEVWVDYNSITVSNFDEIWKMRMAITSKTRKDYYYCYLKPHNMEHLMSDTILPDASLDAANWIASDQQSTAAEITSTIIEYIYQNSSRFNARDITSFASLDCKKLFKDEWKYVDPYFLKQPEKRSDKIIDVWTSRIAPSSVASFKTFGDYSVIHRLERVEVDPERRLIRNCDMIDYNIHSSVVKSDHSCAKWVSPPPSTYFDNIYKFAITNSQEIEKANLDHSTKPLKSPK